VGPTPSSVSRDPHDTSCGELRAIIFGWRRHRRRCSSYTGNLAQSGRHSLALCHWRASRRCAPRSRNRADHRRRSHRSMGDSRRRKHESRLSQRLRTERRQSCRLPVRVRSRHQPTAVQHTAGLRVAGQRCPGLRAYGRQGCDPCRIHQLATSVPCPQLSPVERSLRAKQVSVLRSGSDKPCSGSRSGGDRAARQSHDGCCEGSRCGEMSPASGTGSMTAFRVDPAVWRLTRPR
jgi:hypothetical protein